MQLCGCGRAPQRYLSTVSCGSQQSGQAGGEFAAGKGLLVTCLAGGPQRFQIDVRRESYHARARRPGADLFESVHRGKGVVGKIGEDHRRMDRGASRGYRVERRGVFDFGAYGGGDCVDLRAKEQVADNCERNHIMSASLTGRAVPSRKRAGEKGARSIEGLRPLTRSAITSPVIAESRMPLRKCPAA